MPTLPCFFFLLVFLRSLLASVAKESAAFVQSDAVVVVR